ncbi:MAG: hypothetical protein UV80_C0005G0042 [Candidatus Peregrinibacteria bacterium GW2011_GWF2_43_17]|nr:MAG: hypothetical protein UV80_C0005G0042 [Candidatus Peregrinibacteria bacterium GW2011_GWF2_43_17]KKT19668.1 MAG: hypothetical protein UW03_C0015G0044 [Candidatus Peregrinibacteria bacterium GW2011_GWA2_43_8]HAU40042.1 hypothetical protein [Candidatus Peregrinibacteria bacterium]
MSFLKKVYSAALLIVLTGLFYVYVVRHGGFSETKLVNMSYVWVPCAVFGITGFLTIKGKHSLVKAITCAVLSIVLLGVFFIEIWPLL